MTHPEHKFDLFTPSPPPAAPVPVVIVIHGGGWNEGPVTEYFREEAEYFAKNGMAAYVINYELATDMDPSWAQNIDDVRTAANYIVSSGGPYGVDGSRLAVFGGSSGGHLAALLSSTSEEPARGIPPIVTSVTWSGGMALTGNADLYPPFGEVDHVDQQYNQLRMIGCPYQDGPVEEVPPPWDDEPPCPESYEDASPVEHVGPAGGPVEPSMLMFNSTNENVDISAAWEMHRRLGDDVLNRVVAIKNVGTPIPDESTFHSQQYECVSVDLTYRNGTTLNSKVVAHTARWLKRELYNDQSLGVIPFPASDCA